MSCGVLRRRAGMGVEMWSVPSVTPEQGGLCRGAGQGWLQRAECVLVVASSDPATGAALRPSAIRSLTLRAKASVYIAVVTVTPLGEGAASAWRLIQWPCTKWVQRSRGGALKQQQPVAAAWGGSDHINRGPAPGSPAIPTGVYAAMGARMGAPRRPAWPCWRRKFNVAQLNL